MTHLFVSGIKHSLEVSEDKILLRSPYSLSEILFKNLKHIDYKNCDDYFSGYVRLNDRFFIFDKDQESEASAAFEMIRTISKLNPTAQKIAS